MSQKLISKMLSGKVVYSDSASDRAGRTHDRNLQPSKSLKLILAKKEPSTHDSAQYCDQWIDARQQIETQ